MSILSLRHQLLLSLVLLLICWSSLGAQDISEYVEVRPGALPIILTAPHGGTLKPGHVRTRTFGRLAQDSHTAELTLMIAAEMEKRYGARPHAVICRLHRTKIDCNRELDEAAQGDPVAIATWRRFHQATEAQRKRVVQDHGAGLLLDIHGHRHEDARVELGYLLTGPQLAVADQQLESEPQLSRLLSIRELNQRSPASLSELLRGRTSLGGLLELHDFRCVPSPSRPSPGKAAYFSGAYIVAAHGSRDHGSVSAIQVECPWDGVRDTPSHQARFAKALAEAVGRYFEIHFGKSLNER